ncbi:MAG: acyl-CoA dehydrogenase [Acidimicrobiales bacterium]|nr:acyl-CoA dehydrogenase [Acidimicrobiales bacterium]
MDDLLTSEQEQLRADVRDFIDGSVIPAEDALYGGGLNGLATMEKLKAEAKERGLWALGHPKEIGGGGLPFMAMTLMNAVIGRSFFGQSAIGSWSMQDSIMLNLYGTDEQKARWLGPLVAGEIRSSIGMTEPEVAGSDPKLIQSTAVLDGDEWVINAHKWFTTGANIAAFTTVFAVTEPDDAPPHRRISSILVPTDSPGYEVVRVMETMGETVGAHCEIRLTDVRVPADHLLGGRGEGFLISQKRLGPGRIFHCMRWLGQAIRAFELMCEYSTRRFAHGSMLSEKGEIQRYIAESAADIQAHRLLTLDAAQAFDRGEDTRLQVSLAKFRGAQILNDVIDRAIQVHGALGITADTPLERMYREARGARIYDGPDEVHRMVVARKLAKDPGAAPWAS